MLTQGGGRAVGSVNTLLCPVVHGEGEVARNCKGGVWGGTGTEGSNFPTRTPSLFDPGAVRC